MRIINSLPLVYDALRWHFRGCHAAARLCWRLVLITLRQGQIGPDDYKRASRNTWSRKVMP